MSFGQFRDHANQFAKQLPLDLRQLTIHDETHTDALWEIFEVVFPVEMVANPLEAYVLGGAFLVHDLGHALCMYPGGIDQLKATKAWNRSSQLGLRKGEGDQVVLENAIRLNHANHAQDLAKADFASGVFLIDDTEIRTYLGKTIGTVAYSHWWDIDELIDSNSLDTVGAMPVPNCPHEWTVDPRKLAFVLRVCDACQIDARRAPIFAKALRKPMGVSSSHWGAQQFLAKPFAKNGEVYFTSLLPFDEVARDAWWTAYDLAKIAACELAEAEAYFASKSIRPRVARVSGITSPRSFSRHVKVDGWEPVETRPTITAVSDVIRRLGGAELYGMDHLVPIRELIQNARDAVLARRTAEKKASSWGEIRVTLEPDDAGDLLKVADNGIGMSERTMTKHLLDFGSSYWNSGDCLDDFPLLDFAHFSPVGEFGIGFFSVFMLGSQIKVISRSASAGQQNTLVLEFRDGLASRPVFRIANPEEQLFESGTSIAVTLSDQAIARRILTPKRERLEPLMTGVRFRTTWTLAEAIAWECPASDVDILVVEKGVEQLSVEANDWISMEAEQLFRRLFLHREDFEQVIGTKRSQYLLEATQILRSPDGSPLGRACLVDNLSTLRDAGGLYGIATCGPFRASIQLLTPGILLGRPKSASRLDAEPFAFQDHRNTSSWATRQAIVATKTGFFTDIDYRSGHAAYVRSLCGDISDLEVYLHRQKTSSVKDVISSIVKCRKVYLFPVDITTRSGSLIGKFDINNASHIGVTMGRMTNGKLLKMNDPLERSNHPQWNQYWYSLWGAAIEAVAASWNCDLTQLLHFAENVDSRDGFSLDPAILNRPA